MMSTFTIFSALQHSSILVMINTAKCVKRSKNSFPGVSFNDALLSMSVNQGMPSLVVIQLVRTHKFLDFRPFHQPGRTNYDVTTTTIQSAGLPALFGA